MALIIDGHNLIGVLPGINLGDPDDELSLLALLRSYRARAGGQPLIVFFDPGDLPPAPHDLSTPGLQVRFAQPGQTADDAILAFLQSRAQPGQYAVVTNDRGLADRARLAGASTLSATIFAGRLAPRKPKPQTAPTKQGPDPHDPAFADLYTAFIEAEKNRARFPAGSPEDIAAWTERLYGEDLEEAQRAARWLGHHGGESALDPLLDALTHSDTRVRAAALLGLGDVGNPAAVDAVCDRLLRDAASLAREAAAQALGRLGGRQAAEALEQVARSDPKRKVRKAAQDSLAQLRARRS